MERVEGDNNWERQGEVEEEVVKRGRSWKVPKGRMMADGDGDGREWRWDKRGRSGEWRRERVYYTGVSVL